MRIDATARAIVTGASRGIGTAIADELAGRGAGVGRLSRSTGCDVGDRAEVDAAVARFAQEAGGLDLVVANAGIAHYGPFAGQDVARAEEMTRVNWLGTLYTVRAALDHICTGHLVIVSSGAGLRAFPWAAAYGATKAAQRAFAEALRHELDGRISVTTVFPGEIATSLHDHEKDRMPEWYGGGADPRPLARALVEQDRRTVAYPPFVRVLGLNGLSPRLTDAILRRLRGASAAPRRG